MKIDINCDLGGGYGIYRVGADAAMLRVISSANVACGLQAGDPVIMDSTVGRAKEWGVDVGAKVSFPVLDGFGRRSMQFEAKGLEKMTIYQLGALESIARAAGKPMTHVTFHRESSRTLFADPALAQKLMRAVKSFNRSLIVIVPPLSELHRAAMREGMPVANVVFADRTYDDMGRLLPTMLPGAVVKDPTEVAERVVRMLDDRAITSFSGKRIPVDIHSVLVDGQAEVATTLVTLVRDRIECSGGTVVPVSEVIAVEVPA